MCVCVCVCACVCVWVCICCIFILEVCDLIAPQTCFSFLLDFIKRNMTGLCICHFFNRSSEEGSKQGRKYFGEHTALF